MSGDVLYSNLKRDLDKLQSKKTEPKEVDLSDPIDFVMKHVSRPKSEPQNEWFKNREYLFDIYRDQSLRMVIVKARQMEISEYAVNMLLYWPLVRPGTYVYSSSTLEKVQRFSSDRFRRQINRSPDLKSYVVKEPQVYRIYYGESILYFYSAYENMDTLRGIPADFYIADEFQDYQADALPVAQEMMARSNWGKLIIIGTPKEAGTKFQEYWNDSTRQEWTKPDLKWIPNPPENKNPNFTGFHISQLMALDKWIKPEKIEYARLNYSKQQFQNEVLGEFYTGLGRPITPHMIYGTFDPLLTMKSYTQHDALFAGVDWGVGKRANTVFWLIRPVPINPPDIFRFDTLYIEKIDEPEITQHYNRILHLCSTIPLTCIACDLGEGANHNQQLWKALGDKVVSINNVNRPTKLMEVKPSSFGYIMDLDKTYGIDKAYDTIVKGHFRIYNEQDETLKEWVVKNFTSMYPEVSPINGKKEWKKDPAMNNDALLAYVYALFAFELHKGNFTYDPLSHLVTFI